MAKTHEDATKARRSRTAKKAKPGEYTKGRRPVPAATDGSDDGFTPLESAFCDEYLVDLNATQAYMRARGPNTTQSNAKRSGPAMLKREHIKARIAYLQEARRKRTEWTADDVLREWGRIGFFDIRNLYREDGTLKLPHELDADTARAVHALKVFEEFDGQGEARQKVGEVREYKVIDKHTALTNMARHLGLFKDQVEVSGSLALRQILHDIDGSTLGPPAERDGSGGRTD